MRLCFKTASVCCAIVVTKGSSEARKFRVRRSGSKRPSSEENIMETTQDNYFTAYRYLKL
jgi:hypothetical protein